MKELFLDPLLRNVEVGTDEWFKRQADVIAARPLTRKTYNTWYSGMLSDVSTVPVAPSEGSVLEIGSGSGYVKRLDPSVITSDIVAGNVDAVVDAQQLPFADASLRGILLTHVFHHIPDITRFLDEAMRTLVPGGVITMVDVAHTPLSKLIFGKFHPEDYDPSVLEWRLNQTRPLGGANQALSWIVLVRDQEKFASRYPGLHVETIEFLPWLGYLLSGGATRRSFVPDSFESIVSRLDRALAFTRPLLALHWHVRIRKIST